MQVIIFYAQPPTQPKAKSNYLRNAVRDCASANRIYGLRTGPTLLEECQTLRSVWTLMEVLLRRQGRFIKSKWVAHNTNIHYTFGMTCDYLSLW